MQAEPDQAAAVATLLREIRDNQQQQLAHQAEALTIQREQFALFKSQLEQTQRLQDRAEQIQAKSAQLVGSARKMLSVVVPVIVLLLLYVSWLILR